MFKIVRFRKDASGQTVDAWEEKAEVSDSASTLYAVLQAQGYVERDCDGVLLLFHPTDAGLGACVDFAD